MPPGKSKQIIPVPAPTLPSANLGAELLERPLDVGGGHGARIGHVAVVALADHRQHDVVGAPARGEHRGLVDRADRVRSAEVHGRLHLSPLVDLELGRQLADAVDRRHARGRRQGRRRHHGDARCAGRSPPARGRRGRRGRR